MLRIRSLRAIFLLPIIITILFVSACGSTTATVGVSYKPPFVPVSFSIDSNGSISIQGNASIVTPLGVFSLTANISDSLKPEDNTLLLIIRHKQPGKVVDDVYKIQTEQDEVRVVTNGATTVDVTQHKVFIDASKGDIKSIEVKDANSQDASSSPSPIPTAAPIPTLTPEPRGYQADWSKGMGGWTQSGGWSSINGMLVNNGSAYDGDGNPTAIAPSLSQDMADYSVQVEIRLDRYTDDGSLGGEASFGVVVRSPDDVGGYKVGACVSAGIFSCGVADHELLLSDGSFSQDEPVKQAPFRPAYGTWHTYRIDVKGNNIIVRIDGAVIFQVTDDKYLAAGSVGLWSDRSQISVRSFKIIAL